MNKKGGIKNIEEALARYADLIIKPEELKEALKSDKVLRIKYGVDVTAPFLHIGHAVNLWLMRIFQENGHKVVLLVGDFTTKIGDPTGRNETRKEVSDAEIASGAKAFIKQVSEILLTDKSVFEVRLNSEWYKKVTLLGFVKLLKGITHSRLIERDMFQKRISDGNEIYMHELIYPVFQGYDSVMVKSDLTIIGSDQLFNEMLGRNLQERFGQNPQIIITTKITPGIHGGPKQSKSLGNYIAIDDSPREKYGKTMSIPDNLITQYFEVYTALPFDEIREGEKNADNGTLPRIEFKKLLAREIVKRYHGDKAAEIEKDYFESAFQKKELPAEAPEISIKKLLDLSGVASPVLSKSELRRLVSQNAVEFNGKIISDANFEFIEPGILRIGKKLFFRVIQK